MRISTATPVGATSASRTARAHNHEHRTDSRRAISPLPYTAAERNAYKQAPESCNRFLALVIAMLASDSLLPITPRTGFGSGRRCAAARRLRRHEPVPNPALTPVGTSV